MRLAVLVMREPVASRVRLALDRRGFRALLVDQHTVPGEGEQVCLFVPVRDTDVPELGRTLSHAGASAAVASNPLLPFADPAEYYVSDPAWAVTGGASVYLTRLRRYEEIH